MQIQKLILVFILIIGTAFADDEGSCMDKAQYLAVGLKLTEHLSYAVEHVNKGMSVAEVCAQPFRAKYYEEDLKKFNEPLILARIGLDEVGVTISNHFNLIRRERNMIMSMPDVCVMVEKHLTKNNRCLEPEDYMRTLITKKILSNTFQENCLKYLDAVVSNLNNCSTKK